MANIKSQKKRIITSEKARLRNASFKSQVRTASKKVELAVSANDKAAAEAALLVAVSLIDKSVVKGCQTANSASRQKSHLQRIVNEVK